MSVRYLRGITRLRLVGRRSGESQLQGCGLMDDATARAAVTRNSGMRLRTALRLGQTVSMAVALVHSEHARFRASRVEAWMAKSFRDGRVTERSTEYIFTIINNISERWFRGPGAFQGQGKHQSAKDLRRRMRRAGWSLPESSCSSALAFRSLLFCPAFPTAGIGRALRWRAQRFTPTAAPFPHWRVWVSPSGPAAACAVHYSDGALLLRMQTIDPAKRGSCSRSGAGLRRACDRPQKKLKSQMAARRLDKGLHSAAACRARNRYKTSRGKLSPPARASPLSPLMPALPAYLWSHIPGHLRRPLRTRYNRGRVCFPNPY